MVLYELFKECAAAQFEPVFRMALFGVHSVPNILEYILHIASMYWNAVQNRLGSPVRRAGVSMLCICADGRVDADGGGEISITEFKAHFSKISETRNRDHCRFNH